MLFENLNLVPPILRALQEEGYTTPTPIQAQAIPFLLQRHDLLGCAQTGTGKTAAFAIPILQLLSEEKSEQRRPIRALILTPTRELAIQIEESFKAYGRHLDLRHAVIFGGVSQHAQTETLRRGVDILVATPGRLLDLMQQRFISLQQVKMFILDEADRMLDMGFIHDVKKVIQQLPSQRQTLLFSATMPKEIQGLADSILKNPKYVEVTPVASTADTITQSVFLVERKDKPALLRFLLKDKNIKTALVFSRTKHGADKIAKYLNEQGVRTEAIHGNKSQNARQRALTNFKAQTTRVLVATDIAARGIDIDELTHVINFDLPNIPETYVHRIGRTGRAGASGIAFSFCDVEEVPFLKDINKLIAKQIPIVESHPFPASEDILTAPPPQAKNSAQRGRSSSSSSNRAKPANKSYNRR